MSSLIKHALIKVSGNYLMQKILTYNVRMSQYFMGIGSGGEVEDSGEIAMFKELQHLAQTEYCIFDVGANKGQFATLLLNHLDGYNLSVHSFEPATHTFQMLQQNLKDHKQIRLNNIGLGEKPGKFTLYYNDIGSGWASLTKRKLAHFGIEFDLSEIVTIDTVDNYCLKNDIHNIDLLKLDVEGHELDVLRGAENMFQSHSIKMVSFEFGGCNIDTKTFFQDFYYFFKERNMAIYRITPSGYLYPIPFYNESYEQFRTTNFLALNSTILNP